MRPSTTLPGRPAADRPAAWPADFVAHWRQHEGRLSAFLDGRAFPGPAFRKDTDHLLGEVLVRALRRWAEFQAGRACSVAAWLHGIARDVASEAGRRANREVAWPDRSSRLLAAGLVAAKTPPPEAAARNELLARMRQALDRLDPIDRDILRLKYEQGLPHREIARRLGISPENAATRCSRAKKRLRELCGLDPGEAVA
ncbi:MAG: sigma-70 family RNA polymerase sigma factor [Gemmataceae bacterium]|nr:sigma-70 family RNA polymerase sigma factor [Gemmataceae bacterium]